MYLHFELHVNFDLSLTRTEERARAAYGAPHANQTVNLRAVRSYHLNGSLCGAWKDLTKSVDA
jgi:hypothetical protein